MINKFVEEMSELMLAVHDYERRVTIASPTLGLQKHSARTNPCATRTAAPRRSRNRHPPHQADCSHVNNILLRSRGFANLSACIARAMREKVETAQLLGNVRVKLRTYGLRGYEPPEGLRVEVCVYL